MGRREAHKKGIVRRVISMIDQIIAFRSFQNLPDEKREELKTEVDTLRRLALIERAPRIAVIRAPEASLTEFLETIGGDKQTDNIDIKSKLGRGRWFTYDMERGPLDVLDLVISEGEALNVNAIDRQKPDLLVCLPDADDPKSEHLRESLESVVKETESIWGGAPRTIIAAPEDEAGVATSELYEFFRKNPEESFIPYECLHVVPRLDPESLPDGIVLHAPLESQLRLARLTSSSQAKRRVADRLVRASSGLTGTIASVPIPFADILPITGIQLIMLGTIARISGRPFNLRSIGQFLGAMSLNVGAGLTFRKLVRTFVQFVPFAGAVVSAAIASGGTYALGRTATLYYLNEDV
jgi:uncharacterized protein (DUF697 family)